MVIKWYHEIRRPLPSFGLGGAAPGITVGVQHGPVPALSFSMAPSRLQKLQKLLSGTFSATLPAAFDGLSLLCHGSSRGPTSCFCWASKLLSGTSEAPQAVSIGFRNCYLARFQHPLKPQNTQNPRSSLRRPFAALPWDLPRPHELFLLGFENVIWHFRGATSCFYWASKLLSGTLQLSTAIRCFAMGPPEAPQAVSVGLRNCYLARFQHPLKASKPSKPSQQLSTAFTALPWVLPRPHELFLLGFETAIWHFRSATSCFYWASKLLSGTFSAPLKSLKTLPAAFDGLRCFTMGPPEAPRAVSVGLRNCYLALPKRHKMFLLGFETAIWHVFSTP